MPKCVICNNEVEQIPTRTASIKNNCPKCGIYEIGFSDLDTFFEDLPPRNRANISGWLRENQNCIIIHDHFKMFKNLKTPSVGERGRKILSHLSKDYPSAGTSIPYQQNDAFSMKLEGISWSIDLSELLYILNRYLLHGVRYLDGTKNNYVISPKGWSYLYSLKQVNPDSQIGFVAMDFSKDLKFLYTDVIEPAIKSAGYDPKIMWKEEHNNKIDDEIIALIRQSKFLVADLTKQNNGAYFEAGFAMGLGLPIIWMCKKGEEVHFDTTQYNRIVWEEGNAEDAIPKLQKRIEATIGKGTQHNNHASKVDLI